MQSLPTRAELADRFGEFERTEGRRSAITAVLFIAALFANQPVVTWAERYGAGWVLLPMLAVEVGAAIAAAVFAKQRARDAGVSCPACGAVFVRPEARRLAVATGNCGECAAAVGRDGVEVRGTDAFTSSTRPDSQPMRWVMVAAVAALGLWFAATMYGRRTPNGLPAAAGVTVQEAAARIAASRGHASVVVLYGTRCRPRCRVLADLAAMVRRHPEAEVLAFSVEERDAGELPALLWRHDANFAPVFLRRWPKGTLDRAMAPLGIRVGATWTPHLVAVRDAEGGVVVQGQGVQDVAPFEDALERLRRATVR